MPVFIPKMLRVLCIAGAFLADPPSALGQPDGEGPPGDGVGPPDEGSGPPDEGSGGPTVTSSSLGPECDESGASADYSEVLRSAFLIMICRAQYARWHLGAV